MPSPRGEERDGKAVGFGELEDVEKGQAADRLAVATKKGADREALSAARDAAKMQAQIKQLTSDLQAKEKEMARQSDKLSKLELSSFKLGKEFDREQSELRKMTKLAESRGDDLANLRKKAAADLGTAQDRAKDAVGQCGELSNTVAALEKQLSAANGSLRSTRLGMDRLTKDNDAANQKMLLMRDSVVKLEAELRDTSSRLRIETTEHMKSEERGGKYVAEIKLQKARLEAEQIRAGQCMSNLAQAKTELAVAIEAQAGGGLTPSVVLENDQLKLEREGFVAQIRGLTDNVSRMEVATNNATRQLEKEKAEHVRYHMLYKERSDELSNFKKKMNSAKEANRAAQAELDGKLLEMGSHVKELTRAKAAADADLRAKTTHATNLQAEAKQLQKKIVSLRDTMTSQATNINNLEDELSKENKLRIRYETEAHLLAERLTKKKEQAGSEGRSAATEREQMVRELTAAQAECVRLEAQLKKEKKASASALGAKKNAADDQSKAMQKAQENRERFEKAQLNLGEAQQAMREEQALRIGAEKANKRNEVARQELETKLASVEKDLAYTKTALTKASNGLKAANMELAVYKDLRENEIGKPAGGAKGSSSARDYSDMKVPHPPAQPRGGPNVMNESGPLKTPNLDAAMGLRLPSGRLRRVRRDRRTFAGSGGEGEDSADGGGANEMDHGYRDDYEPLHQFKKEIDRLSEPVTIPGFGGQGQAASARAAARASLSAR
jgi:chromosome segregation ATPase